MTVHNKMRNANLFPHWFQKVLNIGTHLSWWKKYWSTTQLALSKHFRCLLNFLGSKTRPLTKNDETLSNMRAFSTFCQVSIIFFLIALQKNFQLMTLLVSTLVWKQQSRNLQIMTREVTYFFLEKSLTVTLIFHFSARWRCNSKSFLDFYEFAAST